MTRFTSNGRDDTSAVWSPDGRQLIYHSGTGAGDGGVRVKRIDLSAPEATIENAADLYPSDWTSDGRYILGYRSRGNPSGIWLVPALEPKTMQVFSPANFSQLSGMISPDGHWIAYQANETARYEVYVQPFPSGGAKRQVSTEGGTWPRWSKDGRELYFIGMGGKMMAAAVTGAANLDFGVPKVLFSAPAATASGYDVSKDGRFLIPVESPEPASPPLTVVLNWQTGLKK
jgi:Tol biopolymer transport system component